MADSITRSSLQVGLLGTEKPTGSNYVNNGYHGYHVLMLTVNTEYTIGFPLSTLLIRYLLGVGCLWNIDYLSLVKEAYLL